MRKKLRSPRGETLVETLVAIVVISLASVALASMIGAASKMNMSARDSDNRLYTAVSEMEAPEEAPTPRSVTVTFTVEGAPKVAVFQVDYYGDANGMLGSYRYGGGGA